VRLYLRLARRNMAEILGGDVVYRTTIELELPPADLRPGMSVEVHFAPSE